MDIASAVCSRYSTSRERELEKKSRLWVSIVSVPCRASPVTIRNSTRNLTDQIIAFISFVLSTLWRRQVLTITNILTFQFLDFGSNYSKRDEGLIAARPFWRFHCQRNFANALGIRNFRSGVISPVWICEFRFHCFCTVLFVINNLLVMIRFVTQGDRSGAPNENIVQNHLNVFKYLNGRYRHIFIP